MKKSIKILLIFSCVIILLNVIEGIIVIDEERLNNAIEDYFYKESLNVEEGKGKVYSFKELDTSKFGTVIDQYSLVREELFHYGSEKSNTIIYPIKFKVISVMGFYKVISATSVKNMKDNVEEYKKTFPEDVQEDLNNNYYRYKEELDKEGEGKKAEEQNKNASSYEYIQ